MGQVTAATIQQCLEWVESTPHHYATTEVKGFFILRGRGNTLRIPNEIKKDVFSMIEASRDGKFDTRMFRVNAKGHSFLKRMEG